MEELEIAIRMAKEAGKLMMKRRKVVKPRLKADNTWVTEADVECEKLIKDAIRKRYKDDGFIGEELGEEKGRRTWIIDPIDGTHNYLRGLNDFCCSIALKDRELVVGVVYNPKTDELFTASRGEGAFLNGKRIDCSSTERWREAIIAYELSRREDMKGLNDAAVRIARRGKSRKFGSAALDLCYVADGRIDACILNNAKAWDVAAGKIIVEEAGGRFTNIEMDGKLKGRAFIASNKSLFKKALEDMR